MREQPFHSSYVEKPKSRNSSIEELLGEQPFYSSYIEKPKSRNLIIEELLSEQPCYKEPIKKQKEKIYVIYNYYKCSPFMMVLVFLKDKEHIKIV